ncbi:hypothetical protein I4F81_012308 [Pyropia yezoensis]|uniref:Uncharacterized protein n=1 Tax=Pyropia yezoensis TaxID=2788 RepID=A0ACC3CIB8_PYRYE|nr:hypothetical protein I4F81_012308 [Neopyropia yezoensis]
MVAAAAAGATSLEAYRAASPVHVLYGSETGNAEEISRTIHAALGDHGLTPGVLSPMKAYAAAGFAPAGMPATPPGEASPPRPLYVLVTSTTGDGDPPENVRPFLRYLRRKDLPAGALGGVRYALLGLGDTNYENFCAAGKRVDGALRKLGAVRLGPRADADDAVGLEAVVEPFIASVYPLLVEAVAAAAATAGEGAPAAATDEATAPVAAVGGATAPERVGAAAPANGAPSAAAPANGAPPAAGVAVDAVPAMAAAAVTTAAAATAASAPPAVDAAAASVLDAEMADLVAAVAAAELADPAAAATVPPLLPPRAEVEHMSPSDATPVAPASAVLTPAVEANTVFTATLTAATRLTDDVEGDDSVKRVWHLELTPTGEGAAAASAAAYHPGDAFGVVTANRDEDVAAVLGRLAGGLSGDEVVRLVPTKDAGATAGTAPNGTSMAGEAIAAPTTVRRLLAERVDLGGVLKKSALRALAEHCGDDSATRRRLLFLSSRAGKAAYRRTITDAGRGLTRLLAEVAPSCAPPLGTVLDVLPPLPPRWYSAASAPAVDGAVLHVALSVVTTADGRPGLASGSLDALASAVLARGDDPPPVLRLVRRTADAEDDIPGGAPRFRPPTDLSVPLVMVGPGTGVAPFRGFLRARRATVAAATTAAAAAGRAPPTVGDAWLFFGCRYEARDYLYREELEGYLADGTLTQLVTAFSRDGSGGADAPTTGATTAGATAPPPRNYVQAQLRARGAAVAALLTASDTATVYVCGDGAGMAAGVHDALVEVLAAHGGQAVGGVAGAAAVVAGWAKAGRYVRDIWYWGGGGEEE